MRRTRAFSGFNSSAAMEPGPGSIGLKQLENQAGDDDKMLSVGGDERLSDLKCGRGDERICGHQARSESEGFHQTGSAFANSDIKRDGLELKVAESRFDLGEFMAIARAGVELHHPDDGNLASSRVPNRGNGAGVTA